MDTATGQDVADGEVGELWTRSAQNMAGYWNNPAATAEAMTPDGWLRTGDAGYRDGEGYLYLHDRVKDMIVSGRGKRVPRRGGERPDGAPRRGRRGRDRRP